MLVMTVRPYVNRASSASSSLTEPIEIFLIRANVALVVENTKNSYDLRVIGRFDLRLFIPFLRPA